MILIESKMMYMNKFLIRTYAKIIKDPHHIVVCRKEPSAKSEHHWNTVFIYANKCTRRSANKVD